MLVLVKGGQGSGHFGHKGRKGQVGGSAPRQFADINLPDSSYISTPEEAREYFAKHLKGVHNLIVHRKSGAFKVEVDMTVNGSHAYTKDPVKAETKGKKQGQRVFDAERARLMGDIFRIISYPTRIYEDRQNDLFLARKTAEGVQAVVLEWRKDHYEFRSSHHWNVDHFKGKVPFLKPAPVRGKKLEEAPESTSPSDGMSKATPNAIPEHLPAYETHPLNTFEKGPAGHRTGSKQSTDGILMEIDSLVKAYGFWEQE